MGEELEISLDTHAQHIRELVGAVRINIIIVGEELIAAKQKCAHGEWSLWLKNSFGWSQDTANRFMNTAKASGKFRTMRNLDGLSIDASALNLLSAPAIPQEVREEAVAKAKNGNRISIKEANLMVAQAVAREQEQRKTERLHLESQLAEATNHEPPTEEDAVEIFKQLTGRRKLSAQQLACIAIAQGKPVPEAQAQELARLVGPVMDLRTKLHAGRGKEEERIEVERTRNWMALVGGLERINEIELTPQEYFDSLPASGWFDNSITKQWKTAWPWLEAFNLIWQRRSEHESPNT